MSPADLAGFVPAGSAPNQTMLYRVANPDSQQSLAAVHDAITASLPAGAVASSSTWLALRSSVNQTAQLMVPILLAFAAFAFLAAAFIIVNVVSGVVVGNMRQLGLMKAVGATPRDVSAVLVAEVFVPAAARRDHRRRARCARQSADHGQLGGRAWRADVERNLAHGSRRRARSSRWS